MTDPLGDHQSLSEIAGRGGLVSAVVGIGGFVLGKALPPVMRWYEMRSDRRDKADREAKLDQRRTDLDHAQGEIYGQLHRQVLHLERRLGRLERQLEVANLRESQLRELFARLRVIAESDRLTIQRMQAVGQPIDLSTFLELPQIPEPALEPDCDDRPDEADAPGEDQEDRAP